MGVNAVIKSATLIRQIKFVFFLCAIVAETRGQAFPSRTHVQYVVTRNAPSNIFDT